MDTSQYSNIIYYLKWNQLPKEIQKLSQSSQYRFKSHANQYQLNNGKLFSGNKEVIPGSKVVQALDDKYSQFPVGINKLYQEVKGSGITQNQVQDYLTHSEVHQLHQSIPRKPHRQAIYVTKPNVQFQIDLIDMSKYSWHNNGYSWILTCIN